MKPVYIRADGRRIPMSPVEAELLAAQAEAEAQQIEDPANLRYLTSEQQAAWLQQALQSAVDQVMAALPAFGEQLVNAAIGSAVSIVRGDAVVREVERDAAGDIVRVTERREEQPA